MEEKIAYLDNAATTQVCEAAIDAATQMMRTCFGNPSSLHGMGAASARVLAQARASVAALLGCDEQAICFTSGGSEANNLAIFGATAAAKRRGNRIITTAAEHSSIAACFAHLNQLGWETVFIKPNAKGQIYPQDVLEMVDDKTVLVSVMMVNNETGTIFPVEQIAKRIRAKNPDTLIHCDGVQAFGKLPLKVKRTEIDLMSVSGHKICAPKGTGALYIRPGVRILPLIYGGGQERGMRSGTESLPMIAALGAACEQLSGKIPQHLADIREKNLALRQRLQDLPGVYIHSPEDASPYILNISVPGYRSETLMHFLEAHQVYVSSGSACAKGASSPVLAAMGLPADHIDGALRISLIYTTQTEELDRFVQILQQAMASVAHR